LLALSVLLAGCKTRSDAPATLSSATAAASAAPSVASAAAPAKPWFSGSFKGNYEAKLAPVEIKVGAIKEWGADDGKAASGPGKLELEITDEGLVDGTSEGALGPSHASGKVEDDTLRVTLSPTTPAGLRGVLVAAKDGDGFRGSIEASSGDSLKVRQAPVELKKQTN
jgi:hypothetical protein